MGSRVLGFVRDILMAGTLGAGLVADAFFVAFKFPNFFRRLFAEGAFNAAFVPMFGERLKKEGLSAARDFAGEAAAVMISVLLVFTLVVVATMPGLIYVIAPGFADQPDKFRLTIELTQITFPYLTFMAVIALLGGMLNSVQRFAATAAAPILLNIIMIATLILIMADIVPQAGFGLAWGVTAAGVGQLIWIAVACSRANVMIRLPRPRLTPGVRRLLLLMAPGLIGAGVVQINLFIDVILASTLAEGSVSYLYFADRVNQLPLGVVGVAVGVALLPLLTQQLLSGDQLGAAESQNRAIEFALYLTLPAAAALIAIAAPIVSVLFERGAFDAQASAQTAAALSAFAAGLPAYVLIKALTPGFFARQDTATPVKIAVAAMVVNIVLAVALMQVLAHVGIALATACSAWLNAAMLAGVLRRREQFTIDARLRRNAPRALLAAGLMASALLLGAWGLADLLAGAKEVRIFALSILVAMGLALYGILTYLFGVVRFAELKALLRRSTSA